MNKDRKPTTCIVGRAGRSMCAADVAETDVSSRKRRSVQDGHMPRCSALRSPQEMP